MKLLQISLFDDRHERTKENDQSYNDYGYRFIVNK